MRPSAETLENLALSRASLDRAGHRRRDADLLANLLAAPSTRVATLSGDSMRVVESAEHPDGRALHLRPPVPGDASLLAFFLGVDGEQTAYVGVVGADPREGEPGDWLNLRAAGEVLGDRDAGIFTTTLALANWHAAHRFCPRCGAPSRPELGGWLRRCEADGSEHYPRTDPAVIMSVIDDDDRLLLGRGVEWPEGSFSVLAGFVEPGESFEAAVAREVREEVGLAVTNITYLGNQPWPFPSSEMVGFRARAVGTELRVDPVEIAEAVWVTRADYVERLRSGAMRTPSGISIARRLIEHWLGVATEGVRRW